MQILEGHEGVVHALSFSPDGETLVSAGRDGSLRRWEAWGNCTEQSRSGTPVHSLAWSSDGRWLATGGSDGSISVWDGCGESLHASRPGTGGIITGLSFLSGDETLIFTKGLDANQPADLSESIRIWDFLSDKVRQLPVDVIKGEPIRALAALPEKRLRAWAGQSNTLTIWNSQKCDAARLTLKSLVRNIAFTPDGSRLAVTADWKVVVFDVERKQECLNLTGHKGVVSALAYTPDGRYLISGSWDKTVKLWEASTGREVASFEWPVGRVYALAVAPDGLRAAAAGDASTIVIWDVDL
jgi:WD40 repeat protein